MYGLLKTHVAVKGFMGSLEENNHTSQISAKHWWAENDTLLFSVLIAAPWLYLEVLRGTFLPQTLVVFIFKQGVVLAWASGNWLFNRIISLADANEQKF